MRILATAVVILLFLHLGLAQEDAKGRAWNEVVRLHKDAFALLDAETRTSDPSQLRALRAQRVQAFSSAAKALLTYRSAWTPTTTDLSYLLVTFRLGLYSELAMDYQTAKNLYTICDQHVKVNDAAAQYDGKPLHPQVKERLTEVTTQLATTGGGSGGGRLRFINQCE